MSEYQNKAITLLNAEVGEHSVMDKDKRRNHFIQEALELFRTMGGSAETARALTTAAYSKPASEVVVEIGDVMISLAGVGFVHDVDIVQAAYNRMDDGWKSIEAVPVKQGKRKF